MTVYDPRQELAERFSDVICAPYAELEDHITLTPYDSVVVMTPGHMADFEVLHRILRHPLSYIGCIGSRNKAAKTRDLLRQEASPKRPLRLSICHRPADPGADPGGDRHQHCGRNDPLPRRGGAETLKTERLPAGKRSEIFLPYSVLMASISASTSSCVVDQLVAKRATLCSSSTLPQVWKGDLLLQGTDGLVLHDEEL